MNNSSIYLTIQQVTSPKKPVSPDNLALFSANGETSQSEAIECRLATACKACGGNRLAHVTEGGENNA